MAIVPTLKSVSYLHTKAVGSGNIKRHVPCITGQDLGLIVELSTGFETRALNIQVQGANTHFSEYQHVYSFIEKCVQETTGRWCVFRCVTSVS